MTQKKRRKLFPMRLFVVTPLVSFVLVFALSTSLLSGDAAPGQPAVGPQPTLDVSDLRQLVATPTPGSGMLTPVVRTSCDEIRRTGALSEQEKQWFLMNCGAVAPAPASTPRP